MSDSYCKPPTRRKRPPSFLYPWRFTWSLPAEAPCKPQHRLLVWHWDRPGLQPFSSACLRLYCWFPAAQHPTWPTEVDGEPKWTLPGPSVPSQTQQLLHGGQGNSFFPRADGSDSVGVCRDGGPSKRLCVCVLWGAGAVERSVSVRDKDRAQVWSPP